MGTRWGVRKKERNDITATHDRLELSLVSNKDVAPRLVVTDVSDDLSRAVSLI